MSTPIPWTLCPACGAAHDRVTVALGDDAAPDPGSILLCGDCAAVSVIEGDGARVLASDQMLSTLSPETLSAIYRYQHGIAQLRRACSGSRYPTASA